MAKVFAFCNQKGGVGKTTSVVNLSVIFANLGLKTLIIDLDPQGNSTSGLGIDKKSLKISSYNVVIDQNKIEDCLVKNVYANLDLLPALSSLAGAEIELVSQFGREFVLKEKLAEIIDSYDAVLIDCPPSLGLLAINALAASEYLIIPLQCEYYALEGLGQLLNTYKLIKAKINRDLKIGGVVLTMADTRTNLTTQVIDEVRKHFPDNVFKSIIPRSVRISEAPSFGKPVVMYAPESKGSKSYVKLAEEFQQRFFPKKNLGEDKKSVSNESEKISMAQTDELKKQEEP